MKVKEKWRETERKTKNERGVSRKDKGERDKRGGRMEW